MDTRERSRYKVQKSSLLIIGTEAICIFHHRKPHNITDRCSTHELVYELGWAIIRPRNLTFDRFKLKTVQQNAIKSLETFFSLLIELDSKAAPGNVEEDLIKNFFLSPNEQATW